MLKHKHIHIQGVQKVWKHNILSQIECVLDNIYLYFQTVWTSCKSNATSIIFILIF